MTIEEFVQKYAAPVQPIATVVRRWVAQRELRDFLGLPIMAGVTTLDLLTDDRLVDTLSPEVKHAFIELMGEKANTRAEIERLIREKVEASEDHLQYVQVKVYEDADGVLKALQQLQAKILDKALRDGDVPIARLDVAVNSEIYTVVREKAAELEYPGQILDLGETREVIGPHVLPAI